MEVFCGFLDPLVCLHEDAHNVSSEHSYYEYISLNQLGKIIFQDEMDGKQFGLTNDGCFFIERVDVGDYLQDVSFYVDFIIKNIIFPLQLLGNSFSLKQVELVNIYRGQIDRNGFPCKTIMDNRRPSGSFVDNRFDTRERVNAFTTATPLRCYDISDKVFIGNNYPSVNFIATNVFKKSLMECRQLYSDHASFRFDLLSLFLSSATNAENRNAYYFGIMFLETVIDKILSIYDNPYLLSSPKATLGQKMKYIRDKGYLDSVTTKFKGSSKEINDCRNDVFHKAYYPQIENLGALFELIKELVSLVYSFQLCDYLMIRVKYI